MKLIQISQFINATHSKKGSLLMKHIQISQFINAIKNDLRLDSTMEWYGAQTNIPPPSFSPSLALPAGDTPPFLCVENG